MAHTFVSLRCRQPALRILMALQAATARAYTLMPERVQSGSLPCRMRCRVASR